MRWRSASPTGSVRLRLAPRRISLCSIRARRLQWRSAPRTESLSDELFLLQILGDDRAVAQTYVAGVPMKRKEARATASRSQTWDFAPRRLLFIDEI